MAENSKIEWTHHTIRSLHWGEEVQAVNVEHMVASLAERHAIPSIDSSAGMIRERQDVVDLQVPPTIITAMHAHETIPRHAIIPPALICIGRARTVSLNAPAVDKARRILAAWGFLSCFGADLCSRFLGVLRAKPVTRTGFCCRTHLGAAFIGHGLSLHRRDEGFTALFPRLLHNFAAGQLCHE